MHVTSFIDVDTWNKAGWSGALFAVAPDGARPPNVGLLFRNETAGRKIFTDWIGKLGRKDEFELLRISIVEGDIPGQDPGYTVYLGTDLDNYTEYLNKEEVELPQNLIATVGRFLRMNPRQGSPFLPNFKTSYSRVKSYSLIPVFGDPSNPQPAFDLGIEKSQIHFMKAECLGKDEVERVVLMENNRRAGGI